MNNCEVRPRQSSQELSEIEVGIGCGSLSEKTNAVLVNIRSANQDCFLTAVQ